MTPRSNALAPLLSACLLLTACGTAAEDEPAIERVGGERLAPLLVVGIDGATFDRILPLIDEGRLPHLARLMREGASGALETLEPTVSPAIWTTVATGRVPAEHGILGFDGVPGRSMTTLPNSEMRRVRAFWNVLSEHGASVGVIGWWATWPAEPVNGYVVSDRTAYTRMEAALGRDELRPHEVFPPELAEEVRPLVRSPDAITGEEVRRFVSFSDEEADSRVRDRDYGHGDLLSELKYVHQSDRSTVDIAIHLMRTRPTDVTAVALYGVDTMSHLAWHFMEPERFPGWEIGAADVERFGKLIDRYYEFTDELLGRLLEQAGEKTNVVVFSDHGHAPTGAGGIPPWSGGHGRLTPGAPIAPDGVLFLSGPAFRPGVRLRRPHVLDLAPTLLYLQGLPLAADMPGGVHREAFRAEFGEAVPLRQIPTYEIGPRDRPRNAPAGDEELDAAQRRRLCALGYIECE